MADEITAAIESSIATVEGSDSYNAEHGSSDAPAADPAASATADAGAAAADPAAQVADPAADPAKVDDKPSEQAAPPKRRGPIPFDRHEASLAEARAEGEKAVAAVKAEYEGKIARYSGLDDMIAVMDTDPERYLSALANADPRYATLLQGRGAAPSAQAADPVGDMPKPDTPEGYSQEGLQKLLDWHRAQATADARRAMDQEYAPVLREHRAKAAIAEARDRLAPRVEAVSKLPMFDDNSAAIIDALKGDKKLSLEGAYIKIVLPKLAADRDKMRAEIIEELNGKPRRVSSTTPTAAPPVAGGSGDPIEDAIRASIAGLQR